MNARKNDLNTPLRPCPFPRCGGEGEIKNWLGERWWQVVCKKCGGRTGEIKNDLDRTIRCWNGPDDVVAPSIAMTAPMTREERLVMIARILQDFYSGKLSTSQATDAIATLHDVAQAEPITHRWRSFGAHTWVYDPEPEWLEDHKFEVEWEPVYGAPQPPGVAQSGEYDKLLTSWAECRQLLSDERKKNDGLIAEIEQARAGLAQKPSIDPADLWERYLAETENPSPQGAMAFVVEVLSNQGVSK